MEEREDIRSYSERMILDDILDNVILKAYYKKSYDEFINFMVDTKSKEMLIVVLRTHLYIERELISMLTETILDEKVLQGTNFKNKLDLAHSMGMLGDNYNVLNKINSIRNKYAHYMDYEFDEKEFEDLLSTLSKEDKKAYLEDFVSRRAMFDDKSIPEFNFKAQLLFTSIWVNITVCRAWAKKSVETKLKDKQIKKVTEAAKEI